MTITVAYVSTNAANTAGIYGTYLGLEKKWKREDLFNGIMFADAIANVVAVVLISLILGAIFLVGAIVLHPSPRVLQFFMLFSYLFALVMTGSSIIRMLGR